MVVVEEEEEENKAIIADNCAPETWATRHDYT